MSLLHNELLVQAEHLAKKEPTRPKQASLRRAVSAAYYGLFHLLIFEASRLFVKDDRLLNRINRIYTHGEMDKVSKHFANDKLPLVFETVKAAFPVPPKLKDVARAFFELQQARHDADYNLAKQFTRADAVAAIEKAKQAFKDWADVRTDDLAQLYLACFLTQKQWDNPSH